MDAPFHKLYITQTGNIKLHHFFCENCFQEMIYLPMYNVGVILDFVYKWPEEK